MSNAILLGLGLWFIAEICGILLPYKATNTRPWVDRFRTHWLRWPAKGILAIIGGYVGLYWYETVAVPNLQNGPIGWVILSVTIFIGAGLGISAARHTMTDYSMFDYEGVRIGFL